MSPGRIPWSRIVEYGRLRGLSDDNIQPFVTVIRAMDEAYLRWHAEQTDRNSQAGSPSQRTVGTKTRAPK